VVYFYAALACFAVGLSWLLGSLQVFHRDLAQAMSVILNLWFWLTPIVWSTEIIPERYRAIMQYNPVYYLVQGYRASVLSGPSSWIGWSDALRFWIIAGPVLVLGACVFRRLKPEFADVL
jgi:lipopolysaccharide transport system permease protein/teichoic acid transport system permease protein